MKELQVFDIKLFNNPEFGQVRVVLQNGEPWFVAKDLCDCLDLGNSRQATSRLRDKDKGVISNDTLGGKQEMATVSESGMYELVLSSRKPEAKQFKYWICDEVLPSIRKNGAYMTKATLQKALTHPDFLIQLAEQLRKEQETREWLERDNEDLREQIGFSTCFKQVKGIKWLPDYFVKSDGMYREVGKCLARKSRQMGKDMHAIEDVHYGTINAYHIDVINAFHADVENNGQLLHKYRKEVTQ